MVDHPHRGLVAAALGAATALVGTFLPWVHSGSEARSSYEIFDLVERLGFAPGGVMSWSLRLWALVPLVLVLATVAAWGAVGARVPRAMYASTTVTVVLWIGGTSAAVLLGPDGGLLRTGVGPWVALVGVGVLALASVPITRRAAGASVAA